MNDTRYTYIKSLLIPQGKKPPASRKVWSIDLEAVWLPFFHATNTMGDTALPSEALGAPLRLAVNRDGTVRFTDSGKPVIRVVKDISDMVRLIRDEFTANLTAHANEVATENPERYKAEIAKSYEAGKPITAHDTTMLLEALLKLEAVAKPKAEAVAEAEAVAKPKPKARKVKTPAPEPEAAPAPEAEKTPELVTA